MLEPLHFTPNLPKLQKQFSMIYQVVEREICKLATFLRRKNKQLLKQSDAIIITTHILGKLLGFSSERAWHRVVVGNLFEKEQFPERSRYNRRCRDLLQVIKWIRYQLVQASPPPAYTIMDSLPIPLCHPVRIARVQRFRGLANRGYCASKKMYFYGWKVHVQLSDTGLLLSYVVTAGSVHDVRVAEELIEQSPHPLILADKGYIGQSLKQQLQQVHGVLLYTPARSNSKQVTLTKDFLGWMQKKRKQIETTFSVLVDLFHVTAIRSTSLRGFDMSFATIILAHTLWISGMVAL